MSEGCYSCGGTPHGRLTNLKGYAGAPASDAPVCRPCVPQGLLDCDPVDEVVFVASDGYGSTELEDCFGCGRPADGMVVDLPCDTDAEPACRECAAEAVQDSADNGYAGDVVFMPQVVDRDPWWLDALRKKHDWSPLKATRL